MYKNFLEKEGESVLKFSIKLASQQASILLVMGLLFSSLPALATAGGQTCAAESYNHPHLAKFSDGHALWLPGIGTDFVFVSGPGSFTEDSDGTARLFGTVRSASHPTKGFEVDVTLTGRASTPPPGSPKKELKSAAYVESGGPVDTSTWHYYTGLMGTLTGIDSYDGASIDLTLTGAAFQVGEGANGKNLLFGAASWFDWDVTAQPSTGPTLQTTGQGDINIDLIGCDTSCLEEAISDPQYHSGNNHHALWLPGIGKDFIFDPLSGELIVRDDGSAHLIGTAYRLSNANEGFEIDVVLSGLAGPFPSGSPKKELKSASYMNHGGPVDPYSWIFYTGLEGTLRGVGDLAGAVIEIVRTGSAFQIGEGANGKNINLGASSWFRWKVIANPPGRNLKRTGQGDFNLDIVDCEDPNGGGGDCTGSVLYGVHDADLSDSQIFKMNLATGAVEALGPVHPGFDLESLDISPVTGDLYTTASVLGDFYQVDKTTGDLTLLGNTGARKFREIAALSFHPDGTLWAFQKNIGLMTIDLTDGTTTREWRAPSSITKKWDAIAWDPAGSMLYGSERSTLYRWDPVTQAAEVLCGAGFLPDKTEALDFDLEGRLVGGWHDAATQELSIFEIDLVNCAIFATQYATPYNDIESLGFEICVGEEPPPTPGRIGDRVWQDRNGDGIQDGDEPGIGGVTVRLYDSSGILIDETVTTPTGGYIFDEVPPGDYTVRVDPATLPPGFSQTYDLDGLFTADEASLTLDEGENQLDVDFGYQAPPFVCDEDVVYGVQDTDFDESQLFTIDLDTFAVSLLGPARPGFDLESLDIHPETGVLYTTGSMTGDFYEIDKATGSLILIGNTGSRKFREIAGLSFHPDGTLWAFQKNIGLVTIDLTSGSTTLEWNAPSALPQRWDAIVWNPTGTALWGAERDALYKWDPVTATAEQVCGDGFLPDKTEALAFDPSGQLLGGWHGATTPTMAVFKIDVATCTVSAGDFPAPFSDVESIAFELCEPRARGMLGDRVWNDVNSNGVVDPGEAGYGGVVVELLDSEGVVVATTTTNSLGVYAFTGLPADTYTVRVDETTLPADLVPTFDFDGTGTPHVAAVTLTEGETNLDVDFGYRPFCSESTIYGIHDEGLADSQLFKLDLASGVVTPLGPLHLGQDLESLDLDPFTGKVYTTESELGGFYEVDKTTGALTLIGNTGSRKFREIAAMSFHPDGTLWAFQKNIGLVTIDLGTAATTRVWRVPSALPKKWDALAWSTDGTVAWGSERSELIRYDAIAGTAAVVCGPGFLPDKTEALDVRPDGRLYGGWHNEAAASLSLFIIDVDTCSISTTDIDTTFNDIESLAFEVCN